MNIEDKLERILRELHITISRAPVSEVNGEYVLVQKKELQRQLGGLSEALQEMMDQYEITKQGRNRGELEAEKARAEIVRNASQQAEDIYAASVIYSEDALGRIQEMISEAEKSAKNILKRFHQAMESEKRRVRGNQLELITQLEDLKDTSKYLKLIEERNREMAKEKAKKQEKENRRKYRGREEGGRAEETKETQTEETEEKITYEKPEIRINPDYFKKVNQALEEEQTEKQEEKQEEKKEEKPQRMFSFKRRT